MGVLCLWAFLAMMLAGFLRTIPVVLDLVQQEAPAPIVNETPCIPPVKPFDWEADYGRLYRACPSAFWLAPDAGERKRDVIDVRQDANLLRNVSLQNQLAMLQQASSSPCSRNLNYANGMRSAWGSFLNNIGV